MSAADSPWPPRVGEPLPRADATYTVDEKLEWLLSERRHGHEWARVLHIGPNDTKRFWNAIRRAVIGVPIYKVTTHHGIVCGIEMSLTIGKRTTRIRTFWHYEHPRDAPRLVTAYPRP